jgi:hypothetical protein
MKKLLIKYAPILIALTALADTQMELLSSIGLSDSAIAWIKLLGLLLALFLPSVKESFKPMKRGFNPEDNTFDNTNPIRTDVPTKKF